MKGKGKAAKPGRSRAGARDGKRGPVPAVPITPTLLDGILAEYADGFTITECCAARKLKRQRLYEHIGLNPEVKARYEALLEAHVDSRVERMRQTAKSETDVNRARLLVDVEKWVASRLLAAKYGDRQKIEHDGEVRFLSTEAVDLELAKLVPGYVPATAKPN